MERSRNQMWDLMLAAVCVFICLCVYVCVIFLHSLECLGLGGDHHWCGTHPHQVPGAGFGATASLRRFGDHMVVWWWYRREVFGLPTFFKGSHDRQPRPGPTGDTAVHHRLRGGSPRARTARSGGGERVRLHQFGFGSLCIFPKT